MEFSISENIIAGLPISYGKDLNNAVKIETGATLINPEIVPSNFPRL